MMEIQTITQRNNFEHYFQEYFHQHNTFVKTQSGNIEVNYLGFFNGITALHFPITLNNVTNCLLFSRVNTNIGIALLNLFSQKDKDVFYYSPQKFQIISKPRKEHRQGINIHERKIVFMSEVMSEDILINSLKQKANRVKDIKEILEFQKKDFCEHLKIFFLHEGVDDPRMKYFRKGNEKLIINNISDSLANSKDKAGQYYMDNILPRDKELQMKKGISSEVTVPLLWNNTIPFGYIQVNSSKELSISQLRIIERMKSLVEDMVTEAKLFYNISQRFILSDISSSGFGIVFSDHQFIKVFKENNLVSLELQLPGKTKSSVLASVRHIDVLSTGFIKVGFMNVKIDKASSEYYKKFTNSIQ